MSRFERNRDGYRGYRNDGSRYDNSYRSRPKEESYGTGYDNKLTTTDGKPIVKEKPNFKPSGLLAKDSNNVNGVALKYVAPNDSITPPKTPNYYIYSFKEGVRDPIIYNLTQSYYLIGRDEKIVDIATDDETCSKQHAVIQFRERPTLDTEGNKTVEIRPYLMDLESSNGTFLNDEEVPTSRYVELKNEDVLRFGDSTTDNVLIVS